MTGGRRASAWRILRRLAPAGVAALALCAAAPAVAAPPANDNFADAIELTTPDAAANGTTVSATVEPGEQGTGTQSIWYRITAADTAPFGIDTCDWSWSHVVSVWTGTSIGALTARHAGGCSVLVRPTSAGQVLHIRVRPEYPSEHGPVHIRLRPRPVNDDFPGTALGTGAATSPTVDSFAATKQEGEPGGFDKSVWWSWEPGGTVAVADVCEDDWGNEVRRIEAYTGDALGTLTPALDGAHFGCGTGDVSADSVVRWTPGAGPARLVAGDGRPTAVRVRAGTPPPGDTFVNARPATGDAVHMSYRTVFATAQPGEPKTDGSRLGAATQWIRWTPPGAGTAVLEGCNNNVGARIWAYRGTRLATLQELTRGTHCRQRFRVGGSESVALQAGLGRLVETSYVDAKWGASPANDLFADAEELTGDAPTANGDLTWATRTDEPETEAGATVWYRWTATASAIHVVNACASSLYGLSVRVSTGTGVGAQTRLGYGSQCNVAFDAVKGRSYRIRVLGDPAPGANGAFALTLKRLRGDGARDFNGDGADDLAMGIPGRSVGGDAGAGAVEIVYGRADGDKAVSQTLTQDTYGVADVAEPGDGFGAELAIADFNGDGFDDLVIASPSEAIGAVAGAGAIHVLYGSLDGLVTTGSQFIHLATAGVPGNPATGSAFGAALDGAPLDGAIGAELVVGAPGERNAAGGAYLMKGSAGGVVTEGTLRLSEDAGTTPGVGAAGERFGSAVGIGDADIVIGAPGEDLTGAVDAGVVYLLPEADPTGSAGKVVTQNKVGVPDTAEAGDHFGAAVATGPLAFSGTGGDVLIGAPDEDGTGSVTLLTDAARTPRATAVMSELPTPGGQFGAALDIGYQTAAIGAAGEHAAAADSPTGAGAAWYGYIHPESYVSLTARARGPEQDAHAGTDVAILSPGSVGVRSVYAGAPGLTAGGFAGAGGVVIGSDTPFTLTPPFPAADEHAGASVGG